MWLFANGLGDRGSIPGWVIPKTQKMVLDAAFLNTHHYKVRVKSKWSNPREWSSAPPLHLGVVAIEKGASGSPSTKVANFTFTFFYDCKRWHFVWLVYLCNHFFLVTRGVMLVFVGSGLSYSSLNPEWFGLGSLFNGISTFMDYLMLKTSL